MMGMAPTLRSRTVEGVYQEIWGALTAYKLIRLEMSEAGTGGEVRADRN